MKKSTARKLKALSESVGLVQKLTFVEIRMIGSDLLLTGYGKRPQAKDSDPKKMYSFKEPIVIEQSTEKELKRQYKQNGVQGVAKVVRGELGKRKGNL